MVLYEPLAALLNLPASLGILGPLMIAGCLVILMMFVFMFLLEFILGIFKGI